MANHNARDRSQTDPGLPEVVLADITVRRTDAPTPPARIANIRNAGRSRGVVVFALFLAIAATATIYLSRRAIEPAPLNLLTRDRGPAGVAAAYGYPLDCLSITILLTNRTYARADFNHLNPCGRYTGDPTAIFHYVSGRWRPVLNTMSYGCPVGSLPTAVQTALDVCDPAGRESGRRVDRGGSWVTIRGAQRGQGRTASRCSSNHGPVGRRPSCT
jgi:hypothetical protein